MKIQTEAENIRMGEQKEKDPVSRERPGLDRVASKDRELIISSPPDSAGRLPAGKGSVLRRRRMGSLR